jgi:hypothetical protein
VSCAFASKQTNKQTNKRNVDSKNLMKQANKQAEIKTNKQAAVE